MPSLRHWIVESALRNRTSQFVIDGEAVVLGVDGVSDFDACILGSMTNRCSSMPSTCWLAKTYASCP